MAMVKGVNGLHMMYHTHEKILHRKVKNAKQHTKLLRILCGLKLSSLSKCLELSEHPL